eukprot:1617369-Prymnesium_polylepis.1
MTDKLNFSLDELAKADARGARESKPAPRVSGGIAKKNVAKKGGVFERLGASIKKAREMRGSKDGTKNDGWRKHVTTHTDAATGATTTRLYDTDVVTVTGMDIYVNTGGYTSSVTIACINEALNPFSFEIKKLNDDWVVSDSKFRLVRVVDGEAYIAH